jgi:hypothetical protein
MMKLVQLFIAIVLLTSMQTFAQDTTQVAQVVATSKDTTITTKDTVVKRRHIPKIATRRSLILPGWGQAYNKEYWKIPIVWGFLGTTAGIWIYNNTWYQRTREAYTIVVNNDTQNFGKIHSKLIRPNGQPLDAQSLQFYRNEFRRDRDYSTLYFALFWALNVVDATVFAHLKNFDVSDDLSLKARPTFNPTTNTLGVSLVFSLKNKSSNHSR